MLKEKLQSVTFVTAVLVYFSTSGAIYLLAFWSTFHFDISPFINISDLPKVFVFPFIVTNAFLAILIICIDFVNAERKKMNETIKDIERLDKELEELKGIDEVKTEAKKEKKFKIPKFLKAIAFVFFDINFIIIVYFAFVIEYHNKFEFTLMYWRIVTAVFTSLLILKLKGWLYPKVKSTDFFNSIYIKHFLILFPIVCFSTGKLVSLNIYNNIEIRPIKAIISNKSQPIIDSTAFKILGFMGDKAIISTLDNKRIIVLSQTAYEGLEIGAVQKKKKISN